jgi:AAA+ ATPase superfamily predicted ATPase
MMQNPFRFGEIVDGAFYSDREDEQRMLGMDMRSGQNVVVMSPRRYGKSSLVLHVGEGLRPEGIAHAYVNLMSARDYGHLPDVLATGITRGLLGHGQQVAQRALEWLKDLPIRPSFSFNPQTGEISVEFGGLSAGRAVERTVEQLLAIPEEIARRQDTRTILIMDEFQNVVDLDPKLPALLSSIFQHQSRVSHVFLGSKRHTMQALFTNESEPLYRMGRVMELGPIGLERFRDFIRDRFASTKTPISDEAVDGILDITRGHPNDTQFLCSSVWMYAATRAIFPIPASFVEHGLRFVVNSESARFTDTWDRLRGRRHRAVLAAIAAHPNTGVFSAEFARLNRLASTVETQKAVDRLVELGLIEQTAAHAAWYRVTDTFLPYWLRRIQVIP